MNAIKCTRRGWIGHAGVALAAALVTAEVTRAQEATGACCDWVNTDENGEAVCREVPLSECPPRPNGDPPHWVEGVLCDSQPFDPPCGVAACCHLVGTYYTPIDEACANLKKSLCAALLPAEYPRHWQPGRLCGLDGQECDFPVANCGKTTASCFQVHDEPGCCDDSCCQAVCPFEGPQCPFVPPCYPDGDFCCNIEWDAGCVALAQWLCGHADDEICESVGACCHWRINPNTFLLEPVCQNLSESECLGQLQEPSPPVWQAGELCGVASQRCPTIFCSDRSLPSCSGAKVTCECWNDFCLSELGDYCCTIWYPACCYYLQEFCPPVPPANDECAPAEGDSPLQGAMQMPMPGSRATNLEHATQDEVPRSFCCHTGTGTCVGGTREGEVCVVGADCDSGVCTKRVPQPGATGLNPVWFKWVQPAGQTTAGVHTCLSNSPALDSLLQVFAASDHSSPEAECGSLQAIACNDDAPGCGSTERNSRVCLRNLTPGETYYIAVAAKTENRLGEYRVTLTTSCSGMTPGCPHCPAGEITFVNPPDGVIDARRPHKSGNPQAPEGIWLLHVSGPPEASPECWSACETQQIAVDGVEVQENSPGVYTIDLGKPITPASTVHVSYRSEDGSLTSAVFRSHPGNVNGDGMTNAADLLALVDHLNGVAALPWGKYSGDIDHSGVIGPADIIALIDLLNGAGYAPWYGTPLPAPGPCP